LLNRECMLVGVNTGKKDVDRGKNLGRLRGFLKLPTTPQRGRLRRERGKVKKKRNEKKGTLHYLVRGEGANAEGLVLKSKTVKNRPSPGLGVAQKEAVSKTMEAKLWGKAYYIVKKAVSVV